MSKEKSFISKKCDAAVLQAVLALHVFWVNGNGIV